MITITIILISLMIMIGILVMWVAARASINKHGTTDDGRSCFLDELGNHVYYDRRLHVFEDGSLKESNQLKQQDTQD